MRSAPLALVVAGLCGLWPCFLHRGEAFAQAARGAADPHAQREATPAIESQAQSPSTSERGSTRVEPATVAVVLVPPVGPEASKTKANARAVDARAVSPAPSAPAPSPCECGSSEQPERWLEVSFGSAQKFFDQSVTDPAGFVRSRTIPVTTVRIFAEWLFHPRFSLLGEFDLPLEPRPKLSEGQLLLQYVPATLSGGVRASAFSFAAPEKTVIEGQMMLTLGSTLDAVGSETVFPSLGWRIHLSEASGFTAYAGSTFEFRFNVVALTYGVGHRF